MNQETMLIFFYGNEAQQFSFYRIPKLLFTEDRFKNISTDAKLLYGLMLDRMSLSVKNNWLDEYGRVYIYYRIDEIQEALNCGHDKAITVLAELDTGKGIGLIQRVRQGQGRPTIIYVKRFASVGSCVESSPQSDCDNSRLLKNRSLDFGKSNLKTSENQTSRLPKNRSADFGKSEVYLYSKNKTEMNKTDSVIAAESVSDWDRQVDQMKKPVRHEAYAQLCLDDTKDVLELPLAVYNTDDAAIQINSKDYSSNVVQGRLKDPTASDVGRVLKNLQTCRARVRNRWNYLLFVSRPKLGRVFVHKTEKRGGVVPAAGATKHPKKDLLLNSQNLLPNRNRIRSGWSKATGRSNRTRSVKPRQQQRSPPK